MASTDAAGSALSIIDDTTFRSTLSYTSLLEAARQVATLLGGTLRKDDPAAGALQLAFRNGMRSAGILVDLRFRGVGDDTTEVSAKARVVASFDLMDVGGARARAVMHELARRLAAPPAEATVAPPMASAPTGDVVIVHRGKSKVCAAVLALVAGGVGLHRFYLGTWGIGLVYAAVFLAGLVGLFPGLTSIVAVAEAIRFFVLKRPAFDARYNLGPIEPFTF